MEFFDFINVGQFIFNFFNPTAETNIEVANKLMLCQVIGLSVAAGIYLLTLILGGIGLSKLARRAGIGHRFLGFLPFANTYYTGKIAGEANFFGQKMKRAGLYAMLFEIAYVALGVFLVVLEFFLIRPEYYTLATNSYGVEAWTFTPSNVPDNLKWMINATTYCEAFSSLLWFGVLIFLCVVFFAFYRKYYARSPFIMVFLSVILPFRGIVIFAVRNNAAVDYNAYLRRRAEEYARRSNPYGNGGNYNGNGGGYSGNGGNYNGDRGGDAPDPFSEFPGSGSGSGSDGSGGDSPFSDF